MGHDRIAVAITPKAKSANKRGENRGKTIRYVNVVRDFKPIDGCQMDRPA